MGAPLSLVRAAHNAALDEIRHSELSLALSNHFDPLEEYEITGFSEPLTISIDRSLSEVCHSVAREGAVGETISTLMAAVEATVEFDGSALDVLRIIIVDEARHSALAWQTLRWCISKDVDLFSSLRATIISNLKEQVQEPLVPAHLHNEFFSLFGRLLSLLIPTPFRIPSGNPMELGDISNDFRFVFLSILSQTSTVVF